MRRGGSVITAVRTDSFAKDDGQSNATINDDDEAVAVSPDAPPIPQGGASPDAGPGAGLRLCDPDWVLGGAYLERIAQKMEDFKNKFDDGKDSNNKDFNSREGGAIGQR